MSRTVVLGAASLLLAVFITSEGVTPVICIGRLNDIANGHPSGDDTLILQSCALSGYIRSHDIEDAYRKATERARQ